METNEFIYITNQLIGFYMREKLVIKGLKKNRICVEDVLPNES